MRINKRVVGGVVIVDIIGEVFSSILDGDRFRAEMDRMIEMDHQRFLVNLEMCSHLNILGMGLIASYKEILVKRQGDIALVNLSKKHRDAFHITHIDEFVKVYDSEYTGLKHMRPASNEPPITQQASSA